MEIQGLTPLQKSIADLLWGLDTLEDVDSIIQMLPDDMRGTAVVVRELMIAAALDDNCGDLSLAKSVLDSVK